MELDAVTGEGLGVTEERDVVDGDYERTPTSGWDRETRRVHHIGAQPDHGPPEAVPELVPPG